MFTHSLRNQQVTAAHMGAWAHLTAPEYDFGAKANVVETTASHLLQGDQLMVSGAPMSKADTHAALCAGVLKAIDTAIYASCAYFPEVSRTHRFDINGHQVIVTARAKRGVVLELVAYQRLKELTYLVV